MSDIAQMHKDHRTWCQEQTCWQRDNEQWHTEVADALLSLQQTRDRLLRHLQSIRSHAHAIQEHGYRIARHEELMLEGDRSPETSNSHERTRRAHQEGLVEHLRLAEEHAGLMGAVQASCGK